jgi:hypothetical protein
MEAAEEVQEKLSDDSTRRFWRILSEKHTPVADYSPMSWMSLAAGETVGEAVLACLDRYELALGGGQLFPPQGGLPENPRGAADADALVQRALQLRRTIRSEEPVGRGADGCAVVLRELGPAGCARALGCRVTAGTAVAFAQGWLPPHVSQLIASFSALHCAGAKLTVGARALAKHVHRDESLCWWGPPLNGSEGRKNELADAVLWRLLQSASWMNIHTLPHRVLAYELRVPEGYGARWTVADKPDSGATVVSFRGFLEPPDPDGHAHGWLH